MLNFSKYALIVFLWFLDKMKKTYYILLTVAFMSFLVSAEFEFYWDNSYVRDYTNKKWYYFYQEPWCCIQESPYVSKTKDSGEYTSCPGCWPMGYF